MTTNITTNRPWVIAVGFLLAATHSLLAQLPGGHFTEPEPLPSDIAPGPNPYVPRLTADGRELYFTASHTLGDIHVAKRNHPDEEFGVAVELDGLVNTDEFEQLGSISADGLTLIFDRSPSVSRPGDLYRATRRSRDAEFDKVEPLDALNMPDTNEGWTFISGDELTIYYNSEVVDGNGDFDIYQATRKNTDEAFGNVRAIEINGPTIDMGPVVSSDGLTMFFSDAPGYEPRPNGVGDTDIWYATRSSVNEPFGNVTNLGEPINSDLRDWGVGISADWPAAGSTIYFSRGTRFFFSSLYRATWIPDLPGDFNGRGTLDVADIDLLTTKVREGRNPVSFDLNGDRSVNGEDRRVWVEQIRKTYFGDSNLDGEFNSGDFVHVFQSGLYETGQDAGWGSGDWNGDGHFESGDFVTAFQAGGYEKGPRAALVPEPANIVMLGIGLLLGLGRRR
jgi:hypothetical protein